jgi:tetratricopeptide (TPR) repeat protein
MSGEALYERYKDALRRGHIASIQGRVDEALDAYAEASRIAPERATPHSSAGTALLRRRQPAEALHAFEAALALAPGDEAALVGRAEALAGIERRREAADAWSNLAEIREAAGRIADAGDAARRALELAEGRDRRRALERLISKLRTNEPDAPGRASLQSALRLLEGDAVARPAATAVRREPSAPPASAPGAAGPEPASGGGSAAAPASVPDPAGSAATRHPGVAPERPPEPAPAPAPVQAPIPLVPGALDRALPAGMSVDALARAADAAMDAMNITETAERLLDLAAVYQRDGSRDAALDACYLGLSVAPDDLGLHLALVELYVDHGWVALAGEKVELLDRVAELDGDDVARERVVAARRRVV